MYQSSLLSGSVLWNRLLGWFNLKKTKKKQIVTGLHKLLLCNMQKFSPVYFSLTITGGSQVVSNCGQTECINKLKKTAERLGISAN